jgi:hypothetical protein
MCCILLEPASQLGLFLKTQTEVFDQVVPDPPEKVVYDCLQLASDMKVISLPFFTTALDT